MKILEWILNYTQPLVVLSFAIPGICALILKKWHIAGMNLAIAFANFMIFYGGRFLK